MENKGFEYIETKIHPNKTREIVLENKHRTIGIHFWEHLVHGGGINRDNVGIYIFDKRTKQYKNYKFSFVNGHNIPNKYQKIIIPYINKEHSKFDQL